MDAKTFSLIGSVIFGAVALAHSLRIFFALPVVIGSVEIPMWLSWVGAVVTALLCLLGLRAARR